MTTSENQRRVVNAALIVGVLFLCASLLNLVREQLLTFYFGTASTEATAISLILPLPELIFILISGGALGSAFIPVFARFFADEDAPDEVGAWQLFSIVVNAVLVAATVLVSLTAIFARPLLLRYYGVAIGEDPDLLALLVPMLRIMLLAQIIFGVSGVLMVTLYARQRFLSPAIAVVLYPIGQIIGVVLFYPSALGIAWGMVLGAVLHLLVQIPALLREGVQYRPILSLKHPPTRRVLRLMAPRTLGLSFGYFNAIITPFLAQPLAEGDSVTALRVAFRIMLVPQSVVGRALGTASFPTLAALAARQDYTQMKRILANTLRLIAFIGFPAAVLLIALSQPLIRLVFERGAFDSNSTILTAASLTFYAFALVALAMIEVIARTFYALEDTWTPIWVGAIQLLLMFGLGYWLGRGVFPSIGRFGASGIALGFSISNWFEVVALLVLLRRKIDGIDGQHTLDGVLRIGVAAVAMYIVTLLGWRLLPTADSVLQLALNLALIGAVSGAVYAGVCILLKVAEIEGMIRPIMSRIRP